MGRKMDLALHARWRKRLDRFQRSSVSAVEFCRREGVSTAAFYYWRKRFFQARKRKTRPAPNRSSQTRLSYTERCHSPASFVEVSVAQAGVVEIELPNGALVRLPVDREQALQAAIGAAGLLGNAASAASAREDSRC